MYSILLKQSLRRFSDALTIHSEWHILFDLLGPYEAVWCKGCCVSDFIEQLHTILLLSNKNTVLHATPRVYPKLIASENDKECCCCIMPIETNPQRVTDRRIDFTAHIQVLVHEHCVCADISNHAKSFCVTDDKKNCVY